MSRPSPERLAEIREHLERVQSNPENQLTRLAGGIYLDIADLWCEIDVLREERDRAEEANLINAEARIALEDECSRLLLQLADLRKAAITTAEGILAKIAPEETTRRDA